MQKTLTFSFLLLLACCLTATDLSAQRLTIGGFQITSFGAQMGRDQDMLGDMQANYFLASRRNPAAGQYDYSQLNLLPSDVYSMICENPHFRLTTTWVNPNLRNIELGLNLLVVTGRIDAMDFRTPDYSSYLYIDQYTDEIAIEPTLGYRLGKGSWNLTGILGANVGYHYGYLSTGGNVEICNGDQLQFRTSDAPAIQNCTNTYFYEDSPLSNGFSTRLFAEAKASFTIARRLEMGLHLRRGLGLRFSNNGAQTQHTNLHSLSVSAAWKLRS